MSDQNIVAGGDSVSVGGLVTQIATSAVRHGLTTAGGWLVGHSVIQPNEQGAFVGAGMVLVGVAWSWWQKVGQQKALEELSKLKAIFGGGQQSAGFKAAPGASNKP